MNESWNIEFMDRGEVQVERFVSTGHIEGEDLIEDVLTKYAD